MNEAIPSLCVDGSFCLCTSSNDPELKKTVTASQHERKIDCEQIILIYFYFLFMFTMHTIEATLTVFD
jgi:hypothetical protein